MRNPILIRQRRIVELDASAAKAKGVRVDCWFVHISWGAEWILKRSSLIPAWIDSTMIVELTPSRLVHLG